ncbi:MAG: VWA domain-containing protein [Acidobacteria bacterium]|nr:VWA domain-containing protein [Acidobacteriota bacterium]MBI3657454.1 VWA domain-containing protein [Acidobacteriota bacterium]
MFSARFRKSVIPAAVVFMGLLSVFLIAQDKKATGKAVKNEVLTVNLSPGSRITLENDAGDVSIESWDKPACEINIFKTTTRPENFDKIAVDLEESPNRLRIKTHYKERLSGDNAVSYILSVPPSIDLYIRNTVGKVQIRDVTGRIWLQTERGDIQLRNVVGAVEGKTEAGNIVMELQRPVTRDISVRTDEGSIRFSMAKDLNAYLWAECDEGKVRNSLKFQELFTQEGHAIKGQVGQGGKLVRLQVGRGEISLNLAAEKATGAEAAKVDIVSSAVPSIPSTTPPESSPSANASSYDIRTGSSAEGPARPLAENVRSDSARTAKPAEKAPTVDARGEGAGTDTTAVEATTTMLPVPAETAHSAAGSLSVRDTAPSAASKAEPPPNFRATKQPPIDSNIPRAARGKVTIKVDTNLITLNASVRDRFSGKSLLGLKQSDFDLYEDNVRQEAAYFRPVETPFHLLLLLDISGSIEEKFDIVQEASIRFTQLLKPQDRIAVATFNHEFNLIKDFTNDRHDLARAILEAVPGGGTAFYDAMAYSAQSVFKGINGRRAIVVFTDGVDNQHMPDLRQYGSAVSFAELYRTIEESDITIYSIFLNTEGDPRSGVVTNGSGSVWDSMDTSSIVGDVLGIKKRRSSSAPRKKDTVAGPVYTNMYANAINELNKMADQTGGKMFSPTDAWDLNGVYEQIVDDLSTQYSLGYYPSNPSSDGAWRKIIVKVKDRQDTIVKARKGYYATFGAKSPKQGRARDLGVAGGSLEPDSKTRSKRRAF